MATIKLRSKLGRRGLIVLEVAAFVALTVWVSRNYLADRAGTVMTVEKLQRAIELEPANSEYHLRLGRLMQYNIADMNPESAMEHLKRAADLNPRDPQPWLELSAGYGFQGKATEAEACLHRADALAPNIPTIQWVVGNFYLLQGNTDEAFRHFRVVLAGTNEYHGILFRTAWKATEDGEKILEELIPRQVSTEFSYLNYLLSEKRLSEALRVWKRIAAGPATFNPSRARSFMDQLIVANLPTEAAQVWNDLERNGLIKPIYQPTSENLIVNGDFEEELLQMGFDWRLARVEGVHAAPDGSNFHSPSHSLLISFGGEMNLAYGSLYQYVRVEAGRRYRLRGFMKTEGITTDSGPRLRVHDAYDRAALSEMSESLTGTTGGWNQIILDFRTGPATELIVVGVVRLPSRKLDNLIAGKVWIDDLSLVPLP